MIATAALVDSHCHVAEPQFDADRDAVLDRAAAAGVTTLVCVGATGCVERNLPSVALAGTHRGVEVFATVGVHPHDAASLDAAALATLVELARRPRVVAIGETGLDYYYDHSPRPAQREGFAQHVALARAEGLPLVVHVRDAHAEAADILRAEHAGDVGGVIHCFTGDTDDARAYLDCGFSISVAGIVTFRNAETLRAAVRTVPEDLLLIETDAPYLAPVPHRGRRNEPAFVRSVAEGVAAVRGVAFEELATQTSRNARRAFRLDRFTAP